jgi:putative Ca2+/H+ antiporter (TMEM165/GDT1 family)
MRSLIVIFISVFVAEIGDKTQLATMLFATDHSIGKVGVFFAAAGALVASTLLAVSAGELITRFISASTLKVAAGVGFILVGLWTVISASR